MTSISKRIELLRSELERIVKILSAREDVKKIVLFGSLAVNDIWDGTDIDIIVITDDNSRFIERIGHLYDAIYPYNVNVDILAYTPQELPEMFQISSLVRNAFANGKVLYEAR